MFDKIDDESKAFFWKAAISILSGVAIKLSVIARRGKLTWTGAITSTIIAVSFASLLARAIHHYSSEFWFSPTIALAAISADKICTYFIDRFKIQEYLKDVLEIFIHKYFKK